MEEVHRWMIHVQQYFEEALMVFNSICDGASGTDWRGNLSVHSTKCISLCSQFHGEHSVYSTSLNSLFVCHVLFFSHAM